MEKTKDKKTKSPSVSDVIKEIKNKFGDEAIGTLHDHPKVSINSISSGSFGLDAILGIGGFPRGRIVEIYGPEGSGKTTLALSAIAEAQKLLGGAECAYIDVEHAMDPVYASKLGVDLKKLLISQPDSAEQALDMVESMIRSNAFDVVVIDSVAALTPKDEMEGEMGQQFMGKQARLMGQAMRKLTAISAKSKTVIIFINQIRMIMNVMPGQSPEITPGGRALKFAASVRIDIRRIAQIKKGEDTIGGRVRVKVVKNKVSAPFKQTEFDLMYGEGISREGELLALGEKFKIVSRSGSTYVFGDFNLGRGYDAARKELKSTPALAQQLQEQILKMVSVQVPTTTEEPTEAITE